MGQMPLRWPRTEPPGELNPPRWRQCSSGGFCQWPAGGVGSQRHVQTGESCVYRNRSSGCGIRMALIQFAADCNETKCKSCGQAARIFCTYFQRAGCNSELTPCESRSLNCPGPCPPAPHAASLHRQRGPLSVAKGNGVGASVLKQEMSARALGWFWLKIRRPKSAPLGCASRH